MKYFFTLVVTFTLFFACDKKTKSESIAENSPKTVLLNDSNFVMEKVAKLLNYSEVEAKFGKENLTKDSTILDPEGKKIQVSVLFPNTVNELIINWDSKKIFEKMHSVVVVSDSTGYQGQWHSSHGIQPFQHLNEIVDLNGKPITISGFDWAYGGHLVSWEGGKLDNKRLTCRFGCLNKNVISETDYKSVCGPTEFNVSLEAIKKLNPVLIELTVMAN
ncbi:MAG: hypothetical protein V4683_07490 [Bacteroidota bacterium]